MDDDQALKTAAEIIAAMTDPMDSAYQGEDGLLWRDWVVPSGLCYDLMADFAEGDQTDPGKRAQLVTAARAMIDVAARARVAALEAVAEAARAALDVDPTSRAGAEAHIRLEAALDAASAAETHEVDVRPMTDDEIRAEQLTQPAGDPWLARCTCGAEMLPLYPGEANAWEQGHLGTRPWAQA